MIIIIEIYVDGGVQDNIMYIAFISTANNLNLKYSKKIGTGYSHIAEEFALFTCINILKDLSLNEDIILYTDHISLVNLITSELITSKSTKNYNHIEQIRDILKINSHISLQWIKGTKNLAHNLIVEAYNGMFFDEIPSTSNLLEAPSKKTIQNKAKNYNTIISKLENEIMKKDIIIKDLMKLISKLNLTY